MNKGQLILISLTLAFFCIILGVVIGRSTAHSHVRLDDVIASEVSTTDPIVDSQVTATVAPEGKININTADAHTLTMLPGIGEVLAQRIVDYRTQNGPFRSVDELKNVSGIGDGKLEAILELITTGGNT